MQQTGKRSLSQWQVKGFYPHVPHLGNSMETGGELHGVTEWIQARVPGSVHADLQKAGWIPDPYVGLNSLQCEWVENRWWLYETTFICEALADERMHLVFQGLDGKAHLYLNHELLQIHDGMFEPLVLDITDAVLKKGHGEQQLRVLFEHVPDEMGQIGYTSRTLTQKSRFAYKWDFSTRLVPIGFWDEVYVLTTKSAHIDEVQLIPTVQKKDGDLVVRTVISQQVCASQKPSACRVELRDEQGQLTAVGQADFTMINDQADDNLLVCEMMLQVPTVKLWHANGTGEQALYSVEVQVFHNGQLSDVWRGRTGFRTLRWLPNEHAPADALPYTLELNGEKVYIKGVNMPPLDQQYGTVKKEKYRSMVQLMKEAHINLVRVWGGGLIEKEAFYECCDEAGIMVWQEFIQSSSGIDNVPSKHELFLARLERAAVHALKVKRNHVSLACWSGGNELMDERRMPSTYEDINLSLLKRLVEAHHPGAYFLPTSASGPNEFLNVDQPGQNHDVHGPWKYEGLTGHYDLYNRSDSLLHSEFGVDGCANIESLKLFLPKENQIATTMIEDAVWRHHGEWWDTSERDQKLFGPLSTLEQLTKASQWIQAEGIRYALEANRRRKYQNSGSIIWQFNEPYPNVSCTSLVDYYETPKMAYYWMSRAYAPQHISLKYDKLVYFSGETWKAECYIHNQNAANAHTWQSECRNIEGTMLWSKEGNVEAGANSCVLIASFEMPITAQSPHLFSVRLRMDGMQDNWYLFSTLEQNPYQKLMNLPKPQLTVTPLGSSRTSVKVDEQYKVTNIGTNPAYYVCASANKGQPLYSPQNYSIILPGESLLYSVHLPLEADAEAIIFEAI